MKINTVKNNGIELILTGHWTQKQQGLQSLQFTIEQIPRYITYGVITKAQWIKNELKLLESSCILSLRLYSFHLYSVKIKLEISNRKISSLKTGKL